MSKLQEKRFDIVGASPWGVDLTIVDEIDGTIENIDLNNPEGKFFHATFVEAEAGGRKFRQWMLFENGIPGKDKCGEINITFRKNLQNGRYCVEVEDDVVYLSPTETRLIARAKRSSVDSPDTAVKRPAISVGFIYLNTRRIGGPPVEVFFNEKNWSPQLFEQGKLIDVFEYVQQSYDGPGKTAFMMSLQRMDDDMYQQISMQIRKPPLEDPRD
ncbi:MAG: hypothetical protein PHZ07_05090 [Patescibacteria group bacterium]|nr:hypothetical protein [Patescibacteria group bacterium]MDD4304876.1 hypothetical protein [Patescibacteria group bacterium]MDD4695785.1 hypothetical protein [Patescibacteria group bacterium]